jgi:hypothetical protein
MRHFRLGRLAATAAMLGSTLGLAGGTLLATAGPAHAAAGGVNVCDSFSGSADISAAVPVVTGTFGSCHQQGSGAFLGVLDITGAPAPGDIFWATGHATSIVSFSAAIDFTGGNCPSGDIAADITLDVGGGPYSTVEGTAPGTGVLCADISALPLVSFSNLGPVTI